MSGFHTECLKGAGVNDWLRKLLVNEGIKLLRSTNEVARFRFGDWAVGWVRTRHESACLGGLVGIRCSAEVEHIGGKTEISYLIKDPGAEYDPAYPDDLFVEDIGVVGPALQAALAAFAQQDFAPDGPSPDAS